MGGVWVECPNCDGLIFVVAFRTQQDDLGIGVYGKDVAGEWHRINAQENEDKAQEVLHNYAEQLSALRG